jgi:hypothetical protein
MAKSGPALVPVSNRLLPLHMSDNWSIGHTTARMRSDVRERIALVRLRRAVSPSRGVGYRCGGFLAQAR